MMNVKKMIPLAALVTVSLAVAQKTVTLGWSGAITGPTSDAGASYAAGIEDYCKYANAQNMIPGTKLNCVVRDDQYNNANTQRNFEDYVGNMNVAMFLGYSTGGTLQLKGTIQETKIPTLPGSYHIGNIDGADSDYLFLPISSYSEQLVSLVEWIGAKKKGAKVALVVNPSPFGRAPVDDVKKAAARLGVKIVDVQEVGGNNLDNTALLKRFESAGVEYVIHQNTAGPVANILKDAKRLNLLGKMQHLGAHYTGGEDLTKLAGDAANKFIWATSYYMYDEADKPGIQLVKKIGAQYGRKADTIRSVHYTSGMLVASIAVEAMKRAGKDVNAGTVFKALTGMNGSKAFNPGFTVGPVSFSAKDHVGAESLRLLQADATGNFQAITGAQRSKLFPLVHPLK
ncbi:ABC transporter substrate-binding protein [Deinococcus ficus]|jgi:branched-chain amino acid transport system substrate-binding protein|uniref:ABC transporter substrate-binding protein n=2 Tax=Deinococcus ficus TaxID=317577 RepID=UPI0003B52E75|nr:ABC transporter substrate-binding protein [Deinococcus ficus]GHF81735.1 branched-chain amino acid ABC transporter substrate-binding protein [Deinococcus ficus]